MRTIEIAVCIAVTVGSLALGIAAPQVVGIAKTRGALFLENTPVPGNTTIVDGSTVATGRSPSEVLLSSGGRLLLTGNSEARLGTGHATLHRGTIEVQRAFAPYSVEAGGLLVSGATDARIAVALTASGVRVGSLNAPAEVRNREGVLVARLNPGTALQLQTQAQRQSAHVTGTLHAENGHFLLTDETTNVAVELEGPGLSKLAGSRIDVHGSVVAGKAPAAGASQVIHVGKTVKLAAAVATGAGAGGAAGAASGAGAAGAAAGAATATGISVATVAVVGGVAATAATVGSLYATDVLGSSDTPAVSR